MPAFDPNADNGFELRRAAATGDTAKMLTLLSSGANPMVLHHAPLRWAVRHRKTAAAALLLEHGATLGDWGNELVQEAAANGDSATLTLLLTNMAKPYDCDLLGEALVKAAESNDLLTVNTLLNCGAARKEDAFTAAATGGNMEILRRLENCGANLEACGSRALCNAVRAHQVCAVEYLLSVGVRMHGLGSLSLHDAIAEGQTEIVEMLLHSGVGVTDRQALVNAARTDAVDMLTILSAYGYHWRTDRNDLAATAALNGCVRMLTYILDNSQVDQYVLDQSLEIAVGQAEPVIKLLLERGADPTSHASAAFRSAVQSNQFDIARMLFQAGAKATDLPDTALINLCLDADPQFVIDLLVHGIPVNPSMVDSVSAVRICASIPPSALFIDTQGNRRPEKLCQERLRFCRAVAEAANMSQANGPKAASWLAEAIAQSGQ